MQRCFIDVGGVVYATTRRRVVQVCDAREALGRTRGVQRPQRASSLCRSRRILLPIRFNFLRNNTLTLPSNEKLLIDALLHEAAFFKLRDMERQLSDL